MFSKRLSQSLSQYSSRYINATPYREGNDELDGCFGVGLGMKFKAHQAYHGQLKE
jgi:hypothetical protein